MEKINNWQFNDKYRINYLKMLLWLIDIGFEVNNIENNKNMNNNHVNILKKYKIIYKYLKYKQKKIKEKIKHVIELQNIYRYYAYNPYNGKIYMNVKREFEIKQL